MKSELPTTTEKIVELLGRLNDVDLKLLSQGCLPEISAEIFE